MERKTAIVIAHRLATVRRADVIFVLDKGVIVERGTHEELLARARLYAKLCEIQFKCELVKAAAETLAPLAREKQIHVRVQPAFQKLNWMAIPRAYKQCFRKEFRKQSIRLINRAREEKKLGIYPI